MSYNKSIYQKIILEHNRNPRNFKKLDPATHVCPGNNPMCGDHITVYLNYRNDKIEDISFDGSGCAISKASASLMTEMLKGKTQEEADYLWQQFHNLLTDHDFDAEPLGDLIALEGIKATSSRVKCATLAWKAFMGALESKESISTEES